MKKTRILALLVSLMLLAATAFAETADDPVVVRVGDVEIRLSEAQDFYGYYYSQYLSLYAQSGLEFTDEDAQLLLEAIVDALVQNAVMDNKIAEYGLAEITEEDKAALREEVFAEFEVSLAEYAAEVGLSVEEARESVAAEGITPEVIYEQNLVELPYIRLQDYAVKDVSVSDEEIAAEYNAYVEEDKALYENDAASFEMYSTYYGSQDIFYVPAGFRYVKHILLSVPETISAELVDIEADIAASESRLSDLLNELDAVEAGEGEGEAAEAEDAEPMRTAEEINADLDTEQANYDALEEAYQQARSHIVPTLQPAIDEILQKLQDGVSFDQLIIEYNTDPGMDSSPEGYKVHSDSVTWIPEFRDAAMALANVGDVSDPVLTEYGVHIIQYIGDVPAGPVPLTDEVAELIRESLLVSLQDEAYSSTFDAWMGEYEIETHPDLISLPTSSAADPVDVTVPEDDGAVEEEDEPNEDGSIG